MSTSSLAFASQDLQVTLTCTRQLFATVQNVAGVQTDLDALGEFHLILCGEQSGFADAVQIDAHQVSGRVLIVSATAAFVFDLVLGLVILGGILISLLEGVDVVLVKHGFTHKRENLLGAWGGDNHWAGCSAQCVPDLSDDLPLQRFAHCNSSIAPRRPLISTLFRGAITSVRLIFQ